jgi:DNA-binding MarR family transcriptional regulator
MAANITVKANKRTRGEILALLYAVQPTPVESRTITNALLEKNYVSIPDIAQHLDYLTGKGYIKFISEEDAEKLLRGVVPPSSFVKLTPKGIDLVENTIEDAGVDV